MLEKFLSSVILLDNSIYEYDPLHVTVFSVLACFWQAHSILLKEAIMKKYNRRQFSRITFPRPVTLDFGKKNMNVLQAISALAECMFKDGLNNSPATSAILNYASPKPIRR